MTREEKRNLIKGLLFTSPWLVGFSVFIFYPFVMSIYYSFCYYSVLQPPRFIGFLNYKDLFTDPIFWKSLWNTFYYVAFMIPLGFVTSLSLAMLLNTKVRSMALYRLIFFIPSLVPGCWPDSGPHPLLHRNYMDKNICGRLAWRGCRYSPRSRDNPY